MSPLTVLGILCGIIAVAAATALFGAWLRDIGYKAGRKDADNWWIGIESEADKERQKIWREEAQL